MTHTIGRSICLPAAAGALSALLALACAATAPEPPQQTQLTRAVSPPERKGPPEPLSSMARAILRSRMGAHARDMGDLVAAIMVLDYEQVHQRASAIAADVNLARPLTGDATELASLLPEKFFDLQDELRARAKALAAAAEERNAFQVADAYGRVSETCVRCHATYREGRTPGK